MEATHSIVAAPAAAPSNSTPKTPTPPNQEDRYRFVQAMSDIVNHLRHYDVDFVEALASELQHRRVQGGGE